MTPDAPTSRTHPLYADLAAFPDVRFEDDVAYVAVDGHDVLVTYTRGAFCAYFQGDRTWGTTALGAVLAMFGPKAPRLSTGGTCPHP